MIAVRRRLTLGATSLLIASAAAGQSPGKPAHIGILTVVPKASMGIQINALLKGFRERGLTPDQNIRLEIRSAEGKYEKLPALAEDLVQRKVDLIISFGTPSTKTAKAATSTIPIVAVGVGDPVASGFAASLARPGGNITGTSNLSPPMMVKRMELLTQAQPGLKRVAVLLNPVNPAQRVSLEAMRAAAGNLGVELEPLEVRTLAQIEAAFARIAKQRIGAVVVANDSVLNANAEAVARLATSQRTLSAGNTEFARAGGLIGYGSLHDSYAHAGYYVDKILKGAKPADMPFEQPTKLNLAINLRSAKALGVSVPQALLVRADERVE